MSNRIRLQTSNNPNIFHELLLIPRYDEIIIATPEGKEIASLSLEAMDRDIIDDAHRTDLSKKWLTVQTKSFWLKFNPVRAETGNDIADVYDESEEYYDPKTQAWVHRPYEMDEE